MFFRVLSCSFMFLHFSSIFFHFLSFSFIFFFVFFVFVGCSGSDFFWGLGFVAVSLGKFLCGKSIFGPISGGIPLWTLFSFFSYFFSRFFVVFFLAFYFPFSHFLFISSFF